jgi:hypothetical protein
MESNNIDIINENEKLNADKLILENEIKKLKTDNELYLNELKYNFDKSLEKSKNLKEEYNVLNEMYL